MQSLTKIVFCLSLLGCLTGRGTADDESINAEAESDDAPAESPGPSPTPDRTPLCQRVMKEFVENYRLLYHAHRARVKLSGRGTYYELAGLKDVDCSPPKLTHTLATLATGLGERTGKIGLLTSSTPGTLDANAAVVRGIRSGFGENRGVVELSLVALETKGTVDSSLAKLSELVFNYNIAMAIAVVSAAEARALVPWADKLKIPILFVSPEDDLVKDSHFAFRVFPRLGSLAEALVDLAKKQNFNRLGILRPLNHRADRLITAVESAAKLKGIRVAADTTYDPSNFKSMSSAVRELFNINPEARAEEYKELVKLEKEKAARAGLRFNPERAVLSPQIEIDALLIPDDFKIVRQFVKLLRYHGVAKLVLLGNYDWRSPDLVEPPESSFLRESFFVDFIGPYNQLPKPFEIEDLPSPLFAPAEEVKGLDFSLIGYRVANVILSISSDATPKRWQLPVFLENLKLKAMGFFPEGSAFNKEHDAVWPAFVFSVKSVVR